MLKSSLLNELDCLAPSIPSLMNSYSLAPITSLYETVPSAEQLQRMSAW